MAERVVESGSNNGGDAEKSLKEKGNDNRAAAFLSLVKLSKALADAETTIKLNPQWEKGYFRKGSVLEAMEKYDDALAAFEMALQYNPQSAEVSRKIKRLGQLQKEKQRAQELESLRSNVNMAKHLDSFKSELSANYGAEEGWKEMFSFLVETMETAVKAWHETSKVDTRVYFLLDKEKTQTDKFAPAVNIDKAFESPHTHSNCFTYLRQYAEESFSKAACLVTSKSSISYPQVWKGQGSRKWKLGQNDGIFVQFESPSIRNVWFIPSSKEKGQTLCRDPQALDIGAHEILPRIFKEVSKSSVRDRLLTRRDMGGAASTPRSTGGDDVSVEEYLIATFVGEKSFPLASDVWNKLLELPLRSRWPRDRVHQACQLFDQDIQNFVMRSLLSFIGSTEVSPNSYVLHQELLNFMVVAMSTQLLSGPSPGPKDANPFLDAAMAQEKSIVCMAVRRLLLNYISRNHTPNAKTYLYSDGDSPGILERVGSAAATFVLLPLNYLVNNTGDGSKYPLAESSLHVLLILIHYQKSILSDESMTDKSDDSATSESVSKVHVFSSGNTFTKALANARDVEFDRSDLEGNAYSGPHVRIPFASLFDTLCISLLMGNNAIWQYRCLSDEGAVLLLYSLLQGNSYFKEYVLVRTDMDTMLMPILETLYNASRRTSSNQIYMMLIVLLILSQDSSFNSSIHKMILPSVPWYKEHLLHQTSLGSLMVIILIRTVQHNLSKLRDVYLQTTCLATLANMAPHAHHLSAYASQRLVSLFYMLSRKYNKLSDLTGDKLQSIKISLSGEDDSVSEDLAAELQIFTDFLRLVLDILNAILTYALPRNPEIVYAIMHRQEVFQPFKNHPRFHELVENIYTVLDFFNSRMDTQRSDREWSVQKVLQFIIDNCRSWRGEGMKMFTQLHFSYEQESHPEEFFIPYVWQLALSRCGFSFNPDAINLFPVPHQVEEQIEDGKGDEVEEGEEKKVKELIEQRIVFDP
ncbi:hypothetical protein IGI04_032775 [Brassica rapa subsp. trilocularis]|nr:hypothetical protein IGI04_032775 [Brassica rapa subsp. trilocularis]